MKDRPKMVVHSEADGLAEKWFLPEMTEEKFVAMVRKSRGALAKEDENRLNDIFPWWLQYEEKRRFMLRFKDLSDNTALPRLEKREIQREYERTEELFGNIYAVVKKFTEEGRMDFSLLYGLNHDMDRFDRWSKEHDEITMAIGEALTARGELSVNEIRQRVAQGAFEELVQTVQAERLYNIAGVNWKGDIKDSPQVEGEEVSSTLTYSPWTSKERAKFRRIYNKWYKQVKESYPEEIADNLRLLWRCALGRVPSGTSVFDIKRAQWDAFEELYSEGAMEPDEE